MCDISDEKLYFCDISGFTSFLVDLPRSVNYNSISEGMRPVSIGLMVIRFYLRLDVP